MSRHIGILVALAAGLMACQSKPAEPEPAPAAGPPTIEQFVQATHIHGVPYDEARAYGPKVVPQLLQMLEDPRQEPHWANIVVTLCIIADERAVDPVLAFIARDAKDGSVSRAEYGAKSSAVMALGYIVNRTGNKKCLDYLRASVRSGAWAERGVKWGAPEGASAAARDVSLSKKAILGLALSGRPEAAATLRELEAPTKDPAQKTLNAAVGGAVHAALSEHAKIQKMGLSAYYKEARAGHHK
jgi:hypothetical protein